MRRLSEGLAGRGYCPTVIAGKNMRVARLAHCSSRLAAWLSPASGRKRFWRHCTAPSTVLQAAAHAVARRTQCPLIRFEMQVARHHHLVDRGAAPLHDAHAAAHADGPINLRAGQRARAIGRHFQVLEALCANTSRTDGVTRRGNSVKNHRATAEIRPVELRDGVVPPSSYQLARWTIGR